MYASIIKRDLAPVGQCSDQSPCRKGRAHVGAGISDCTSMRRYGSCQTSSCPGRAFFCFCEVTLFEGGQVGGQVGRAKRGKMIFGEIASVQAGMLGSWGDGGVGGVDGVVEVVVVLSVLWLW